MTTCKLSCFSLIYFSRRTISQYAITYQALMTFEKYLLISLAFYAEVAVYTVTKVSLINL